MKEDYSMTLWPFSPETAEERALRLRDECRALCSGHPYCSCPFSIDVASEAQYEEWREDAELSALDPREAAFNAWDGERPEPVV